MGEIFQEHTIEVHQLVNDDFANLKKFFFKMFVELERKSVALYRGEKREMRIELRWWSIASQ